MIKIRNVLSTALLATAAATIWATAPASSADVKAVSTRLGDLTLENGYPSRDTADRLYDEMDFQRATQAYLWALPAVGFKALYDAQAKTLGAANGDIMFYRDLADKAGMLTPNITTLYAFSFWDLAKQGPMVVDVPEGLTAGGVLDIWQQPITDMGQTGPDKGKGGKYLILPPGSPDIDVPGYMVFRSPPTRSGSERAGLIPTRRWPKRRCASSVFMAGTSATSRNRPSSPRLAAVPGNPPSPIRSNTGSSLPNSMPMSRSPRATA